MIDLVLVGSLIVMVMFSGYEFRSKIDLSGQRLPLALEARRRHLEAEGRGLDRRDFLDPPVAIFVNAEQVETTRSCGT